MRAGVPICAALALAAYLTGSPWCDAAAALAFIGLFLFDRLRRRDAAAWMLWLATAALLGVSAARGAGRIVPDLLPVLVNAALAAMFARSLARGRQPLIARIIVAAEGAERLALPRVAAYARALTWMWALLLGAQAIVLGAIAVVTLDTHLAWPVAAAALGAAGRWYLHAGNYVLVPAAMLIEYLFRRWYMRHIPHASLPRSLMRLARCWPALLHDGAPTRNASP